MSSCLLFTQTMTSSYGVSSMIGVQGTPQQGRGPVEAICCLLISYDIVI